MICYSIHKASKFIDGMRPRCGEHFHIYGTKMSTDWLEVTCWGCLMGRVSSRRMKDK